MTIGKIAAMASAVVAIVAALALFGLDMPKLATEDDIEDHARTEDLKIQRLAQAIETTRGLVITGALESTDLRALRLEQEIENRKAKGEKTGTLEQEVRILRRRVRKYEAELKQMSKE